MTQLFRTYNDRFVVAALLHEFAVYERQPGLEIPVGVHHGAHGILHVL